MTNQPTTRRSWVRLPGLGNLGLPIAEKEVRSLLRRKRYFWLQFFYLAVIGTGIGTMVLFGGASEASPEITGRRLFAAFFIVQTALIYLVFPAFAATSISGERAEQSFDLLLITDLRPGEIIWGKFFGVFGNCCYFLLTSLPLLATCLLFGGVAFSNVVEHYVLLLVQSALITIFGIWSSAASPGNVRAIIVAYTTSLVVGATICGLLAVFFEEYSSLSIIEAVHTETTPTVGPKLVASVGAGALLAFGLCFVLATRPLTSPEANRSTALRVWSLAVALAAAAIVVALSPEALGAVTVAKVRRIAEWYVGVTAVWCFILWILATLFAGERVETPRGVERAVRNRPVGRWAGWLLLPGGGRGFGFALVLLGLSWVGLEALIGLPSFPGFDPAGVNWDPGLPAEVVPTGSYSVADLLGGSWKLTFAALAAYCAVAFLLGALGVFGAVNWWIVAGLAVLGNMYPLLWISARQAEQEPRFDAFSVLTNLGRLWNPRRSRGGRATELVWPFDAQFDRCLWLHVVLAVGLGLAACAVLLRRRIPLFGYGRRLPSAAS